MTSRNCPAISSNNSAAPETTEDINVYDPNTGTFIETLMRADGTPLQFDGLWDMLPQANGVFFTAGISDEEHGLFGLITEDREL